jgi:hypothetical protein
MLENADIAKVQYIKLAYQKLSSGWSQSGGENWPIAACPVPSATMDDAAVRSHRSGSRQSLTQGRINSSKAAIGSGKLG